MSPTEAMVWLVLQLETLPIACAYSDKIGDADLQAVDLSPMSPMSSGTSISALLSVTYQSVCSIRAADICFWLPPLMPT